MIIVTDQWAIDSDNSTQFTVLRRPTAEESAQAREKRAQRGQKVSDSAERTWKPVAYHSRLEDAANALLDRMVLEGGAKASDVAWLGKVVADARAAIVAAVRVGGAA